MTNTRITANSQTTIDHVITNQPTVQTIVTHEAISDHQVLITSLGQKTHKTPTNCPTTLQQKLDITETERKIKSLSWKTWLIENQNNDLETTYNSFHKTIQSCVTLQQKKPRKKKPNQPFFNNNLAQMRKILQKKRKTFLKKQTEETENEYREYQKTYNNALNNAKQAYYESLMSKAGKDSKKIWNTINSILNRGNKENQKNTITSNGSEIHNNKTIANTFSKFYKTAATDKLKNINQTKHFKDFLQASDKKHDTFKLQKITTYQTWQIIKSLSSKTSSGFDKIPPKLVKDCAENLAPPLTMIINKCFETGSFPKTLKLAKITPIHKKGDREPANFRPISQLSTFSKIIEKAAHKQLRIYMEDNHQDPYQFAYKPAHSTTHPIILTRHIIEESLKKKEYVLLVMIDLSLAFDCIETSEILPEKLKHYGADQITTRFFKEFFTGRKHQTEWNGAISETQNLSNHSCVQGSCLGAPIYNLYTKDLQKVCKSTIVNFADDTNIIVTSKNPNNLIEKANEELKSISDYMSANYLLINTKKHRHSYINQKPHQNMTKTPI